jgi:hypothetical protein
MKASILTTEQRTETAWNRLYNIVSYGKYNDQPQRWLEIIAASGTASVCVKRYQRFINGRGFADDRFYDLVVNESGMTADKLLRAVTYDVSRLAGFALQFNYDLYTKSEINYVPFENVRFYWDDKKKAITKFAIHPDWGKRNTSVTPFDSKDITLIDFYNPDPKVIAEQVKDAGGWDQWNGQLLYCSMAGDLVYPAPIYDPVLSDISSEDAIASVKNRNCKNNFLPAGMLIVPGKKGEATENNQEDANFDESFKTFQGAEKACKIIKVKCGFEEEKPEFVPFEAKNFDKEFDYSEKSVQENIGSVFMQPRVLRCRETSGKLGSSAEIKDAHDLYNSITEFERIWIEENFSAAFDGFDGLTTADDFKILPLQYEVEKKVISDIPVELYKDMSIDERRNLIGLMPVESDASSDEVLLIEKIGVGGSQAFVTIITDPAMTPEQKRNSLVLLFGITEQDAKKLTDGSINSNA